MDSVLLTIGLPVALAVIMFGLGLSLTLDDFRRIGQQPKAVAVALLIQLVLLPLMCWGLVLALGLDPLLAVGMILLAAAPGGTTANLFSHVFRGDVALNITLTALNSLIAVFTLPLLVNLAVRSFDPPGAEDIGLQFGKTVHVFAIILVPVAIGMAVRRASHAFAARADRPVRLASILGLVSVTAAALLSERDNIGRYLADTGIATVLFCLGSLTVGYAAPRLLRIPERQAVATAFEVGIHNSTLAITVAISVLENKALAVPAAVYGVLMFPLALAAGLLMRRSSTDHPVGDGGDSQPAKPPAGLGDHPFPHR